MKVSVHVVAALAIFGLAVPPAFARKSQAPASQQDQRELQGRALFARGDYQAALDIYVNLFAEKGDAIYLRNIGRCYQKLEQPDKAINSFREYLRRGHVKASERSEVEGFIQEMEQLRKRQQAAAAVQPSAESSHPPESPPKTMPAPVAAAPIAPPPTLANEAPGAMLTQQVPAEPAPAETSSITGRWWFWTGVAVVVAGGAATAFALTYTRPAHMPACLNPDGRTTCPIN